MERTIYTVFEHFKSDLKIENYVSFSFVRNLSHDFNFFINRLLRWEIIFKSFLYQGEILG